MKKNSHSTYPPFDLVHPIEGTFHERKENGDSRDVGKKGRFRRDFFLEKATRERERERVERKEKECQRARRVRQKGTDWNIFFILLPRGGAHAVNLSFSRRLFQPSLIPGWNFVDRLRRWKVKGLGRNEGIEGDGTFFLGAGCCLHKNNRIVLRDKIKKARNEIFSREHVLSMLKASIFVLILVFPSKIRIEQFYSTFFFFFTCFPAFR